VIASTGQVSTQMPQSTQASISTTALSLTIFIASLGHSGTQDSQPVHFFLSILVGIYITLSKSLSAYGGNELKPISKRRNVTKLCSYYNINFANQGVVLVFGGKMGIWAIHLLFTIDNGSTLLTTGLLLGN
jgi:hypothetical protein